MSGRFTHVNLGEVEDQAPKFGYGEIGEARFARGALGAEKTGVSLQRLRPGVRQAFAHRHREAEEVYVVLSGSGHSRYQVEAVRRCARGYIVKSQPLSVLCQIIQIVKEGGTYVSTSVLDPGATPIAARIADRPTRPVTRPARSPRRHGRLRRPPSAGTAWRCGSPLPSSGRSAKGRRLVASSPRSHPRQP